MRFKLFNTANKMEPIANFSADQLSSGQVCHYIAYLWVVRDFRHIGYLTQNEDGCLRYILYQYGKANSKVKRYFNDRCPAMIEQEIRDINSNSLNKIAYEQVIYNGDIPIIKPYNK